MKDLGAPITSDYRETLEEVLPNQANVEDAKSTETEK